MRCGEIETDPTQDDLIVYLNEMSYYSSAKAAFFFATEDITTAVVMEKNTPKC